MSKWLVTSFQLQTLNVHSSVSAMSSNLIVGVTLISMALCADAVIGNVQEKTMKQYKSSNSEMASETMDHYFPGSIMAR